MLRKIDQTTEILNKQDIKPTFSELIEYIRKGDIKKLEESLKADETFIHKKDEKYSCNLLHWACIHGQLEIVKLLIDLKVDLFALCAANRNCFHYACRHGSNEVVAFLIGQFTKLINQQANERMTPLHLAAKNGHAGIVKLLLENGANIDVNDMENKTPLHLAAEEGKTEVVKILIENHAGLEAKDKNIIDWQSRENEYYADIGGNTPLQLAVSSGHIEVTKLLLSKEANINSRNKEGNAALHIALEKGHLELAKFLVISGADVNLVVSETSLTPLRIVIDKNDSMFDEFALFLLEHGADPNKLRADFPNHPTVLHKVVFGPSPNISLIQNLLNYGASSFIKNVLGRTVMNMVFINRDLFIIVLNSTKYVYIDPSEINNDTIILNKLVTSLLYKSKRHGWNSEACINIRHCIGLLNSQNENCTEEQFKSYIEKEEREKQTFFGSYLSDGDKSDSDEETAYKEETKQRKYNIELTAWKNLGYTHAKLLGDRQKIHHEKLLDKKVSEDLKKLNILIENGISISDAVKQIDTKFYIAQYRGVVYFTNKWNQPARRAHRHTSEINKPQYSASVLFGASNTHSFSEFYKLKNNLSEQQVLKLENDIVKWGRVLKEKALNLRNTEKYTYNGYTYDNLAELLQDVYTKNYTGFEELLRSSTFLRHYLLNEYMPFVSTGDVPYHALKYAYGTKYYSKKKEDKGHKEERLRPRWQKNGKAERPYSGKVYISLHPLEDFDENGPLHLVSLNTKGKINVDNLTIPERESTFPAFLPEERVFFQHIAKYPSFHKPYKNIFLDKYGFTPERYAYFQNKFLLARPHTPEMTAFKQELGEHLCIYYEVKLIEIARKKVETSKEEKGLGGILIYRDEYGLFSLEPPPDTPMRNNKKVATGQKEVTKASRAYRESLSTGEIQINSRNIIRLPKKDYNPSSQNGQHNDFNTFYQAVLSKDVHKVEKLFFPNSYIYTTCFVEDRLTTVLHQAVNLNAFEMVKYLLNKGAFTDVRDADGNTPLHLATNLISKEIIQLLVQHGSNADILNNKNQTPKDIALAKERFDLACCMLKQQEKDSLIEVLLQKVTNANNLFEIFIGKKSDDIPLENESDKNRYQQGENDFNPLLFSYTGLISSISSLPKVLNVSGFGNNCGLFALTLGIKVALKSYASLKNKTRLPNFFDNISEESLQKETKDTAEIAKKLRKEIYRALLQDQTYKTRRYNSFLDCCRKLLEKKPIANDMEAFIKLNQIYVEELHKKWSKIQENLMQTYETYKKDYETYLEQNTVDLKIVDSLVIQLSNLVSPQPNKKTIDELIESYYKEEDIVFRLIKLRRLFRSAWLKVTQGEGIERNLLSEVIEQIFKEKILRVLKDKRKDFNKNLLLFSLLEETNFDQKGFLEKICSKEETFSTLVRLFVEIDLLEQWETIYKNYLEYIKDSTVMLTADELGCLASYWNVQLKIQFRYGQPYTTYQERDTQLLNITLCNPSLIHWNVMCDNDSISEADSKNIDQIVEIIRKIQNETFKRGFINAVTNQSAYACRYEDCSYIIGVVSAIKDIPTELEKQGKPLNLTDIKLVNELLFFFEEQGILKLSADITHRLAIPLEELLKDQIKDFDKAQWEQWKKKYKESYSNAEENGYGPGALVVYQPRNY